VCESASGRHAVLTALATLVSGPGPADLSVFEPTAHDESALFSLRFLAAYAALASGEHRVAHEAVVSLLAYCRSRGLHGWRASCLHLLAETHLAHGRLEPARQTAEEGLRIAEYGAHEHRACHLRATLAVLAALRGDGDACRRLAGSALTWATDHRIGTAAARAHHALALLQLGSTDPQNAYTQLVQIPAGASVLTGALLPDLIEAGTRIGAPTGDAAQRYQQWATTTARPLTAALAARCRALTATEAAVEEHFGEALRSHGQADAPFDEARTRLLYGEWLRRQRRRTDARRQLRAAVETFDSLGAEPWAERARTELRGTGDVADRSRETGTVLDRLTPQEREVVRLAAAGATNRDIAAQLFLSPRTVGHHLYRAFPKLGIASRSQLGELLG
jgi:DNA-binding CsgD family transcriptional regulator